MYVHWLQVHEKKLQNDVLCLCQEIWNLSCDKQLFVYLPVGVLEQFITSPVSLALMKLNCQSIPELNTVGSNMPISQDF